MKAEEAAKIIVDSRTSKVKAKKFCDSLEIAISCVAWTKYGGDVNAVEVEDVIKWAFSMLSEED